MTATAYDIKDPSLAEAGARPHRMGADRNAGAAHADEPLRRERPLDGVRISACLHVTAETANLARVLVAGGAELALCASNPLSTQDDVAAALAAELRHPGVRPSRR